MFWWPRKKLADLDFPCHPLVFLKELILVGAEADVLLLVGPAHHGILIQPTIRTARARRPMRPLTKKQKWERIALCSPQELAN